MAWIESHQSLAQHPKTRRLARSMGISIPAAVGSLHLLWWWALSYAPDGDLTRFGEDEIATAMLADGDGKKVVDALVDAGFLDRDGDMLTVHDWDDYSGRLLRKRAMDAARKRAERSCPTDVQRTSNGRPTDVQRTSSAPSSPPLPPPFSPSLPPSSPTPPPTTYSSPLPPPLPPPSPAAPACANAATDACDFSFSENPEVSTSYGVGTEASQKEQEASKNGQNDPPVSLPLKLATTATTRSDGRITPVDSDPGFQKATAALAALGVRMTPLGYDELSMFLDEGTRPEWVSEAAAVAARNGSTSWSYIRKVLDGWGSSGPPQPAAREDSFRRPAPVTHIPIDQDPLYVGNWLKPKREAVQ